MEFITKTITFDSKGAVKRDYSTWDCFAAYPSIGFNLRDYEIFLRVRKRIANKIHGRRIVLL